METLIKLPAGTGGADGYRGDLPLDRDITRPVVVDATELRAWHPMFAVRLRLFLEWHLAAGHEVLLRPPVDDRAARRLAALGVAQGLPGLAIDGPQPVGGTSGALLPVRRLSTFHDVEDAASAAMEVLQRQGLPFGAWGDAMHTAVGELCDNALQHGTNDLGAFVAADRLEGDRVQFRLAIADLGIGIPEHIRARHPEWHDDTAAISRVLQRGVTGTGDPHRGNGFSEVLEAPVQNQLVRANSAARIDIRSANGRVTVELFGGVVRPEGALVVRPRRGTWITYNVITV